MNKACKLVTIFVMGLTFLSCTGDETVGFYKQRPITKTIGKEEADKVTIAMAIDNTNSMLGKVNELSEHLKGMFSDLINAGWNVDLHVVKCAFDVEKPNNPDMYKIKSGSTLALNGNASTEQKVNELMSKVTDAISKANLDGEGDERCNQALEQAWSQIDTKNKVNISMIVSNEDGCARSGDKLSLPSVTGSRKNCMPITHGQVGKAKTPIDAPLLVWEEAVTNYGLNTWEPWFESTLSDQVIPPSYFVDFFSNLEEEIQEALPNSSHIYLPIVVDSYKCLAQNLKTQALTERQEAEDSGQDVTNYNTKATVGNIGHSYLKTFSGLDQKGILFNRADGDLSLCNDLSHVVNKIQKEIKLRGRGATFELPRVIDTELMKLEVPKPAVLQIRRSIKEMGTEEDFVKANAQLRSLGISWVKTPNDTYTISLYLDSPMVVYEEIQKEDKKIGILSVNNSSELALIGGDEITMLGYSPNGFIDNESSFGIKNKKGA